MQIILGFTFIVSDTTHAVHNEHWANLMELATFDTLFSVESHVSWVHSEEYPNNDPSLSIIVWENKPFFYKNIQNLGVVTNSSVTWKQQTICNIKAMIFIILTQKIHVSNAFHESIVESLIFLFFFSNKPYNVLFIQLVTCRHF